MKSFLISFSLLSSVLISSCSSKIKADLIIHNANIYTVDSSFTITESIAIKDGIILETGDNTDILNRYESKQVIDANGKSIYPGFHDAHCHFYGYGIDLEKILLWKTTSFEACIDTLLAYPNKRYGGWVFARAWDQNDWQVQEFPDRAVLDSLFPDIPVFMYRIDGHAALVNQKSLDLAGITKETQVEGGEIEIKNGRLTGILIDNAVDLVKNIIPKPSRQAEIDALLNAQANCLAVGLTTVSDAGLDVDVIQLIDSLQTKGDLKMRVYAMITWAKHNLDYFQKNGKIEKPSLQVSAFKLYSDGALGSRGACLKHDYSDQLGHKGFLLFSADSLSKVAKTVYDLGFQLNVHCIGDSANNYMINTFGKLIGEDNDRRWRIEHAQIMDPEDIHLFGKFKIIPSVQPTHATSDMYWAETRLGKDRMKGAYAYKHLLDQNGFIAGGSDFPVEDINPLFGFYAAVSRKDQQGFPDSGFRMEDAISREQALRAMTIWAAYAGFMEKRSGSLEKGKQADFVILEKDIMKIPENEIWSTKVARTFIGGVNVY